MLLGIKHTTDVRGQRAMLVDPDGVVRESVDSHRSDFVVPNLNAPEQLRGLDPTLPHVHSTMEAAVRDAEEFQLESFRARDVCVFRPRITGRDFRRRTRSGVLRDVGRAVKLPTVRLVIAECQVDYVGRLTAHLPMARRLLLIKSDGSVSVHADDRAYKPLNWMSPPCWLAEEPVPEEVACAHDEVVAYWVVTNKAGEELRITITSIEHDSTTNSASIRDW